MQFEEKFKKKFDGRKIRCSQGGRGDGRSFGGQNETLKKNEDVSTSTNQRNEGFNCFHDQNFRDQRGRGRGHGQGLGRGGFCGTYFHYNEECHHAFECPQCQGRIDKRADSQERVAHMDDDAQSSHLEDVERGEVIVNERFLLNNETKLGQRRSLFHTRCKCKDKCCDVIINGGSINNLVSEEMVSKLKLKREKHVEPYQIS